MEAKFAILATVTSLRDRFLPLSRCSDSLIVVARSCRNALPVVYYLSRQKNGSVPDSERPNLRARIYFLLFNRFFSGKNPAARVRYLRDVLKKQRGRADLHELLKVIAYRN